MSKAVYQYDTAGKLKKGDTATSLCTAIGYTDDPTQRASMSWDDDGYFTFSFPITLSYSQLTALDVWAAARGMGERV